MELENMKLKEQRDIWDQNCSRSHNLFVSNQKLWPRHSTGDADSFHLDSLTLWISTDGASPVRQALHCQLGLILETKNPAGSGGKESACSAGDPNSIPRIQQWRETWSLQEIVFMHLFLAMLCPCCCAGISLAAESGSHSRVAVQGLLRVLASLVVEHRL